MQKKILFIVLILAQLFIPLSLIKAEADFNPNNIISDYELLNYNSMTLKEIQEFLENHNGVLKNYKTKDVNGRKIKASKIIYNACQKYKINPQVILTILQKEQTLITSPPKKPTQLKWATGFAAYDHREPVEKFGGFGIQIDRTAWRLKFYLDHPWDFRHKVGQTYKINYHKVRPETSATAALYNYTPHIKGNKLFYQIWNNWFAKKNQEIKNGSLVKLKTKPGVWLIENGLKRPFKSKNVFLASYRFKDVKEVSKKTLSSYKMGKPVKFPNFSLIQGSLGEIYLLNENEKRPITKEMFKKIGYHPEEIIQADQKTIKSYKTGQPVTSPYPSGSLLQNKNNNAVFYVKENKKHPIVDAKILNNRYPYNGIIKVPQKELDKFTTGDPIKFRDGTLLKTKDKNTVYLVSKGKIRPIYSSQTFNELGYNWNYILTVSQDLLNLHPKGEIFKLDK